MEDLDMNNMNGKMPINATQIINKYKSLKIILIFCFEKNWHYQRKVGFDANFCLKLVLGQKNTSQIILICFYFCKGEKLDKNYIIDKMKVNPAYAKYMLGINNPRQFSKDFLLLLIAYAAQNLCQQLYSINIKQL